MTKTAQRILILWADAHSANLGVRVLARGAARWSIGGTGEDAHFTFQDFGGRQTGVRVSPANLFRALVLKRGPLAELIRSHDVVVDTGAGDSFTDIYGMKRFIGMCGTQLAALRLNGTLILAPQTIGPFSNPFARALARHIVDRATHVFARDHISLRYACDELYAAALPATDVVFTLDEPDIAQKPRDIVVNVSGLLWADNRHVDSRAYRAAVRGLCAELIAAGRQVTLVAHVLDSPDPDNDVPAVREVADEFPDLEVVIPDSLDHVRAVIGSARAVVGARMHAVLNALSLGVPGIPWAYSRKFEPLLNDLGWEHVLDARTGSPETLVAETLRLILHEHERLRDDAQLCREVAHSRLARSMAVMAHVTESV